MIPGLWDWAHVGWEQSREPACHPLSASASPLHSLSKINKWIFKKKYHDYCWLQLIHNHINCFSLFFMSFLVVCWHQCMLTTAPWQTVFFLGNVGLCQWRGKCQLPPYFPSSDGYRRGSLAVISSSASTPGLCCEGVRSCLGVPEASAPYNQRSI